MHVVLASNPAVGACTGALAIDKGEEFKMTAALHGAFHAVDQEILDKRKEEGGRDGSTGLVLLRIGTVLMLCQVLSTVLHLHAFLTDGLPNCC